MDNKYGPPVCPCISVHSQPNRDPKNLKKNHGGWGFNEQSPDQVSVPCIVHSRGTELQNHDVRFFCFSLSSPSHFLNLAGAGPCSSPRRARLNAEKLALLGLESKRRRGTHTDERRRTLRFLWRSFSSRAEAEHLGSSCERRGPDIRES